MDDLPLLVGRAMCCRRWSRHDRLSLYEKAQFSGNLAALHGIQSRSLQLAFNGNQKLSLMPSNKRQRSPALPNRIGLLNTSVYASDAVSLFRARPQRLSCRYRLIREVDRCLLCYYTAQRPKYKQCAIIGHSKFRKFCTFFRSDELLFAFIDRFFLLFATFSRCKCVSSAFVHVYYVFCQGFQIADSWWEQEMTKTKRRTLPLAYRERLRRTKCGKYMKLAVLRVFSQQELHIFLVLVLVQVPYKQPYRRALLHGTIFPSPQSISIFLMRHRRAVS